MSRAAEERPSKVAVEELLADLAPLPVRARAMFGGYGLYMEDVFFGIVTSEGEVYFRTDDATRPEYEVAGMRPFQPNNRPSGPKAMPRNFQVPPHVREDQATLRDWAARAATARR